MKVAVVGGRQFRDKEYLYFVLDKYNEKHGISHIVSGGAVGADGLAELYAKDRCLPITVYPANWNKHGKGAGYIRNQQIVDDCDVVLAFPDPNSVGTYDTVDKANKAGKEAYVIQA